MTVQGTASAGANSVTIPTHAAGDVILVFTRRFSNAAPTTPTAGGTVPTWTIARGGNGADTLSLVSAWARAAASDTTTGAWLNASHICVLVLRPDSGKVLSVGAGSVGNAASTQTIVYPALTLSTLAGTSWGIRCGTRTNGGQDVEIANPPSGWTNQMVQPAGASALMGVHTIAGATANFTADSVDTTPTAAAYRAHSMEVTEQLPATQQPVAMII